MGSELEARWATVKQPPVDAGETIALEGTAIDAFVVPSLSAPVLEDLPRLPVDLSDSGVVSVAEEPRGELQVRGVLGEGGMGRVLKVRQRSLSRDVAVKTLRWGASAEDRAALLREGAVMGRLEHPSIVPVYALGVDESGRPAIVMKHVEGVSWQELLNDPAHERWRGWSSDPSDRLPGHLQILMQLCNAVQYAHSKGFVHRDLKPENVLIGGFGDVYLADWGVSAPVGTESAELCGTLRYMAPEMARGGRVDERTDVFELGAILHRLLTGQTRHEGDDLMTVLVNAWASEPYAYDAQVPADLAELANRACDVDPARRPVSAEAFRDALARHLAHRDEAELALESASRLPRIEALHALHDPSLSQREELDRLIAEASFGLERALREWHGDDAARAAMARLDAIGEERRARADELSREARERDPRPAAKARAIAMGCVALCCGFNALASLAGFPAPSKRMALLFGVGWYGALAVGTFLLRERLLRNRLDRQLTMLLHVCILVAVVGRAAGLFVPISAQHQYAADTLVMIGVAAAGATAYGSWLAWGAANGLVYGVLCLRLPEHARLIYWSGLSTSFWAFSFYWWRAFRSADRK